MGLPATVRVNTTVNFPSLVFGTGPISVTKTNGVWAIGLNPSGFPASGISFLPTGGISATDMQSALAEVDAEKAAIASLASVALSGAGADLITNIGIWTPVLTFATPGNLAVSYTTQVGRYVQISSNVVLLHFNILTSAFTFTTATGAIQITGSPFTTNATAGLSSRGVLQWGGITKAGYTHINPSMGANSSLITINGSGSAQPISAVVAADTPTGGTVQFIGDIIIFL